MDRAKIIFLGFFFFLFINVSFAQQFAYTQLIDTSLIINKKSFAIKTEPKDADSSFLIVDSEGERIQEVLIHNGSIFQIKLDDINKDKNPDIVIQYFCNVQCDDLYLFDPKENKFRYVTDFASVCQERQLTENSEYYFSYCRAGCADYDWVSYLFKIENFEIVLKGYLDGRGCGFDSEIQLDSMVYPLTIEISKINNNDETQKVRLETLPYKKYIHEFSDKWKFIEKYWRENYSKFE